MTNNGEVWYEIQFSTIGESDWFSTAISADSLESARRNMVEMGSRSTIEFRIVKVTHCVEPVAERVS